jgi:hypothetical protein
MIDNLINYLKKHYFAEHIEYEGENEEGFYFKLQNQENEYFEFRVLKSKKMLNDNIEMRKAGNDIWNCSGLYDLNKLKVCI